jgi:G3E family GTPase
MRGISDPEPVIETFFEPDLLSFFSVSTVLSVVDAEKLPELKGEVLNLAKSQIEYADIVVVNKIDLVDQEQLDEVNRLVHQVSPTSRIIEVEHGRVPFELVFGDNFRTTGASGKINSQIKDHLHSNSDHIFTSWNWKSTNALSLYKLRAALDRLPASIYRCKGSIYIEELTMYRYIIQMVGKRLVIMQGGLWDGKEPGSEIVLIGSKDGINEKDLQLKFDACIGKGDDSESPILRLARKIAPELVINKPIINP